jgi:D-aminopeptidase
VQHAAECLRPVDAQALVKDTAAKALDCFKEGQSSLVCPDQGPITLDISTKNYRTVEMLAFLPIVERVDSHTARFVLDNMAEVSRMIEFVTGCGVTELSP